VTVGVVRTAEGLAEVGRETHERLGCEVLLAEDQDLAFEQRGTQGGDALCIELIMKV
jgi:hypothetical protein